ncbi:hypothetical protein Plhal304r1_c046g0126691 [Plasmopara halstedii]
MRRRGRNAPATRCEPCYILADVVFVLKLSTSGGSGVIPITSTRHKSSSHMAGLMRAHPLSVLDPRVEYSFRSADPATEARKQVTRSNPGGYVPHSTSSSKRRRFCTAKRTIPVVLTPGKSAADDKEHFERWVPRHQKLPSSHNLLLSHRNVDARVGSHYRLE